MPCILGENRFLLNACPKRRYRSYVGQDRFEEEHIDFIESFRQSFSSISTRYRVEVPVSEIAYVFDYISVSAAPAREERLGSSSLLFDE